ncbi:OmpA/MotB family protein [Sulfitobacter sp.]|mgnify:CR=1 FL=1|uniref:OmpA/MotB family protein n=1 Tax=Sulfitobacter sp. TaxID=1903071 RepID=UPI003F6D6DA7
MAAHANAAPVIIKRKKVVKGGGHHGGAWKVAYADFVTAMMAFFMLMWLLNATTEQQRKGLADYFTPTIAINRISGGGDGNFGGESIFTEMTLPKNGTGATTPMMPIEGQEKGDVGAGTDGPDAEGNSELFKVIDAELMGRGGESMVMDNISRHVITRQTDEGMVIELFDVEGVPLFKAGGDQPTQMLRDLLEVIVDASKIVTNKIAVAAHVRSNPIVAVANPVWDLSAQRANQTRKLLEKLGIEPNRIERVSGFADRKPATVDTMDVRNNRVEFILLR